jgi:hypothetical protein
MGHSLISVRAIQSHSMVKLRKTRVENVCWGGQSRLLPSVRDTLILRGQQGLMSTLV